VVANIKSCTLVGIDAELVDVECTIDRGLPQYSVVGLAAPSVKEGATRIQSALKTVGYDLPLKKVTINLAPADLRKPGCGLDLPIALAVLVAEGVLPPEVLADLLVLGELGLDGTVRSVRGVLAAAMLTRATGMRGIVIPDHCAAEAEVVEGVTVHAVHHLGEIIAALRGDLPPGSPPASRVRVPRAAAVDMAEVRGQSLARAAVEVAVAGGHNLLLAGPPGTGESGHTGRASPFVPPFAMRRVSWPIRTRREPTAPRAASSSTGSSRRETASRRLSRTRTRRSCRCTSRSTRMRRFSGGAALNP
jgi:magnesium chelatase family protein